MSDEKLKKYANENIQLIKNEFDDELLKTRDIINKHNENINISLIFFGLLVNREFIQDSIVKPIIVYQEKFPDKSLIDFIKDSLIVISEVNIKENVREICDELMFGKTVLFVDGYKQCLVIETNDRISRAITEPEGEIVLRGPREGFTESLVTNIGLLRRRIINKDLKFKYHRVGKETNMYLAYMYIDSLVDTRALDEFQKKLDAMDLDAVIDTNTVTEAISYRGLSPFEIVGQTERPDTLSAKLLEGKIGVMLDGTPVAITLPFLFIENFQANEDYYLNSYFVLFARMARGLGFLISTLTPALYVSIITFHWEIVPTRIALTIAQAQEGLTLPTAVEAFFMLVVFEILRETGIRTPSGLGQSMSIVGALVIGQAAIQARIVSPVMVIVIALTTISGLVNYKIKGASITIRILNLIAGMIAGLFGIFTVCFIILFHLTSIRSFGVQYIEKLFPLKSKNFKDSIMRTSGEGVARLDKGKK